MNGLTGLRHSATKPPAAEIEPLLKAYNPGQQGIDAVPFGKGCATGKIGSTVTAKI